ncbi:MAG: hypothetical protein M0P31_11775 [Solirubrobacteraceae bacterium]|nr:hypothetical protein [Solirubrobacteraceae bacterium]
MEPTPPRPEPGARRDRAPGPPAARGRRPGPATTHALREATRAYVLSRLVVWGAGLLALLVFGWVESKGQRLDPLSLCRPGGGALDALASPGCRYDATWYLLIAQDGYDAADPKRSAFFPLYPYLVAALAAPFGAGGAATVLAGLALSAVAAIAFLTLLHRAVAGLRDPAAATTVVRVAAYLPPAVVLSALYTEGLFLLLSLGAMVAARRGRWWWAGLLGAAAAACRSVGVLLVVPLLVEAVWGRRSAGTVGERRATDVPAGGDGAPGADGLGPGRPWWWPPRRPAPGAVVAIALVGLGLVAVAVLLAATTDDALGFVHAQDGWERRFLTPVGGIALGAWAVVGRALELVGIGHAAELAEGQSPALVLVRDLLLLVMVAVAVAALWWARRRMPVSWVAWGAVALAYPLSVPAVQQPLMSLPRFAYATFPVVVAIGLWAHDGGRARRLLPALLVLQGLFAVLFVAWGQSP